MFILIYKLEIQLFFVTTKALNLDTHLIKSVIEKICFQEKKIPGNINFIFCNNRHILLINQKYLNHNYPTDVITFNYNNNNVISGDVFIGLSVIKKNAKKYHVSFKNELYRIIIHSILHLVGYNDKSANELKIMRKKEDYYLKYIKS